MSKKSLLFVLLMALFMPWAANAQTVTIGEGTSTYYYSPINNYYNYSFTEMIYTASEIAVGNPTEDYILSVGFQLASEGLNGKTYNVDIYMKNVTDDELGTSFVAVSDEDKVFTGTVSATASGWVTRNLDIPFQYDNTKNLLVAVNKTGGGYAGSNYYWNYTATTKYQSLYKQNDSSGYDPSNPPVSPTQSYNRPNVQLTFGTPPSCPKPTMNAAQNVDSESVSLSWTENGSATNWVLQYSTNEDFTNAVTRERSGIPALAISDLTPLTTYYARVKSNCGGGDESQWSDAISFTTTAVAQNVGDGWADDFEGTSCGWGFINGTLTNAWSWGTAASNGGTHGLYISNDGGTTNAYTNNSAAMVYATKLLKFTEGKFEFSYDWICNGESTWDYLRVALVPATATLTAGTSVPSGFSATALPTGWIALDGGSKLNGVTSWQSKSLAVNVTAGTYYLVLAWRDDTSGGSNPPAAVDNVSITKIACDHDVTNLSVSDITTNSAALSWNGGEATQWQVVYGTASSFEGATEEIVDETSYNMSNLQGNTTYYVRVRAYCGGEDFGSWTDLPSFNTACEAFDLESDDFTENFDDMTAPSSYTPTAHTMPDCWNVINTCSYSSYMYFPTVTSYNGESQSGSNYLRFYSYYSSYSNYDPQDQYAILPPMENLDGKQIKLSVKGSSTNSTFYVGLMTNPTDPNTFVAFATQAPTTSYVEYEFPISGTGNYIAIKMDAATSSETSHGLYIDDIVVEDVPTCLKPTDLAVTGTTITTATLSWTNGASTQTAWQICLNGDETNLIMANSNPFTIEEGLTPGTLYTAKVRAYCNADDQSEWSDAISFVTECEAFTITRDDTYSQGFEGYTGVAYNAAGIVPPCWDSYSTGSVAPHIIGSGTGNYVYLHEGTNALTFYGNGYCYAALPEFTNALSELEIKFWMQTESGTNGTLVLGYITADDEDYNTFTEIETYANNNSSMVQRTTDLNEVPATATRLVFRWYYSGQWSCCIDDVEVTLLPTCTAPTALEVTATTTNTATLSWTAGGKETAWQICLNGDETNLIMADSNPFTVEGLTASTAYTAKVRAYCSADDQSDWSNEVSFTTNCDVFVVDATHPFTEDFEGSFAPLCWQSIPYVNGSSTYQWSRNTTHHAGSYAAYSGYYGPIYLVMPDLQLGTDGDGAQLSFWSNNTYVNDYEKNSVVLLDGDDEIELWSPASVVGGWEEITIDLTQYMGETVSLAFKYEGSNAHGWYVDDVQVAMVKTYILSIDGYEDDANEGGYYLIASPVTVDPSTVGMTTGDFDLYAFDQSADNEWLNYEANAFNLEPGKGYLYAHKTGGDFTLTGVPYSGNGEIELDYDNSSANLAGWNLVGNPFGVKASPDHDFYTMNDDGSGIDVTVNTAGTEVDPMTGIFVVAVGANETVTFETGNSGNKSANLALNVTKNNKLVDRAIVRFEEGRQLPKFQLRESSTKVYIEQDNKDYAIVNATEMGEMPVSFKAEKNGTYTLGFTNENVEFGYLHLIDNMTGADIDLIETPSYSFEAKVTDYASRFKLMFATGNNSNDDNFAFYNNGSIVINNNGEAILNVVDVLGRTISSQTINGSANVSINAKAGVYMLQLVKGDKVQTQKIVVE